VYSLLDGIDYDPLQVAMGQEVEKEHTDDPDEAKDIAREHLREPDTEGGPRPGPKHREYYTHLRRAGLAPELVGWKPKTKPKADIMPGGSLGTVGGTTGGGISGIGGGL
jgi:hypothetical protein